jgi:molecular chaperone GrpE
MRSSEDRSAGAMPPDVESTIPSDEGATPPHGDPLADATATRASAADAAASEADPAGAAELDGDATSRLLEQQRDKYLRLAAEYDNYRRRTQRERQEAGTRAQADLVKSLLDALDDLDRFAQVDASTATAQSVIDAVSMVGRKVAKALTSAGLEVVNPAGEPFDPSRHEALTTAPAASPEEDHTVAQVYQPGYVFGGQLLRPARVVVRQWNG